MLRGEKKIILNEAVHPTRIHEYNEYNKSWLNNSSINLPLATSQIDTDMEFIESSISKNSVLSRMLDNIAPKILTAGAAIIAGGLLFFGKHFAKVPTNHKLNPLIASAIGLTTQEVAKDSESAFTTLLDGETIFGDLFENTLVEDGILTASTQSFEAAVQIAFDGAASFISENSGEIANVVTEVTFEAASDGIEAAADMVAGTAIEIASKAADGLISSAADVIKEGVLESAEDVGDSMFGFILETLGDNSDEIINSVSVSHEEVMEVASGVIDSAIEFVSQSVE